MEAEVVEAVEEVEGVVGEVGLVEGMTKDLQKQ